MSIRNFHGFHAEAEANFERQFAHVFAPEKPKQVEETYLIVDGRRFRGHVMARAFAQRMATLENREIVIMQKEHMLPAFVLERVQP